MPITTTQLPALGANNFLLFPPLLLLLAIDLLYKKVPNIQYSMCFVSDMCVPVSAYCCTVHGN